MKRFILSFAFGLCVLALTACGDSKADIKETAKTEEPADQAEVHKLGVLVYDVTDEEVLAFREYLEGYIEKTFGDVDFQYSESITSEEQELAFIRQAGEAGVEGILSFLSYDLEAEVEACGEEGIYYLMASGTVPEEQYQAVAEDPWFLGVVGPGEEIEARAAKEMASSFSKNADGPASYFIMSGGSPIGNEMHRLRTVAILDQLQEDFGVTLGTSSEELALSPEVVTAEAGDLKVCIAPGYISREEFLEPVKEAFASDHYDVVLSVLPVVEMGAGIGSAGSGLGVIDCYTTRNLQLFTKGTLDYIAGKYGSLIGPSFALMYNAVTGFAEDFREEGRALRLTQGFWSSAGKADYEEKFSLASSLEVNAYNYEDLYAVCKVYDSDASVDKLKELASASSYEDACARRGLDE